jgi:hypothetical protein
MVDPRHVAVRLPSYRVVMGFTAHRLQGRSRIMNTPTWLLIPAAAVVVALAGCGQTGQVQDDAGLAAVNTDWQRGLSAEARRELHASRPVTERVPFSAEALRELHSSAPAQPSAAVDDDLSPLGTSR